MKRTFLKSSVFCMLTMAFCSQAAFADGESDPGTGDANGKEYVDMGLSVNWSTANMLGADGEFGQAASAQDFGGYFGWADPTGLMTSTNRDDYQPETVTDISGTSLDIARTKWGGSWRLPTQSEMQELSENCELELEIIDGITCLRFISNKNGASIVLPFNGVRLGEEMLGMWARGSYWTGTPLLPYTEGDVLYVYCLDLDDEGAYYASLRTAEWGLGVRPVFTSVSEGISTMESAGSNVISTEYFDVSGRKISSDHSGMTIKKVTYADKTTRVVKVMK